MAAVSPTAHPAPPTQQLPQVRLVGSPIPAPSPPLGSQVRHAAAQSQPAATAPGGANRPSLAAAPPVATAASPAQIHLPVITNLRLTAPASDGTHPPPLAAAPPVAAAASLGQTHPPATTNSQEHSQIPASHLAPTDPTAKEHSPIVNGAAGQHIPLLTVTGVPSSEKIPQPKPAPPNIIHTKDGGQGAPAAVPTAAIPLTVTGIKIEAHEGAARPANNAHVQQDAQQAADSVPVNGGVPQVAPNATPPSTPKPSADNQAPGKPLNTNSPSFVPGRGAVPAAVSNAASSVAATPSADRIDPGMPLNTNAPIFVPGRGPATVPIAAPPAATIPPPGNQGPLHVNPAQPMPAVMPPTPSAPPALPNYREVSDIGKLCRDSTSRGFSWSWSLDGHFAYITLNPMFGTRWSGSFPGDITDSDREQAGLVRDFFFPAGATTNACHISLDFEDRVDLNASAQSQVKPRLAMPHLTIAGRSVNEQNKNAGWYFNYQDNIGTTIPLQVRDLEAVTEDEISYVEAVLCDRLNLLSRRTTDDASRIRINIILGWNSKTKVAYLRGNQVREYFCNMIRVLLRELRQLLIGTGLGDDDYIPNRDRPLT